MTETVQKVVDKAEGQKRKENSLDDALEYAHVRWRPASKGSGEVKELLMGCGSRTKKDIYIGNKDFENVTRLDINPDHNPDIVWDLTVRPLPFLAEEFDEIHAYQVLEHLAYQGDYEFFLCGMERVLQNPQT